MSAKKAAKKAAKIPVVKKAAKKAVKAAAKKTAVRPLPAKNELEILKAWVSVHARSELPQGGAAALLPLEREEEDFCSDDGREALKRRERTRNGVTRPNVVRRTNAMLYCEFDKDFTGYDPSLPIPIPANDRVGLRGVINGEWFNDVGCNIGDGALRNADTLTKLYNAIYAACRDKA